MDLKRLEQPLDPKFIKPPPKGKFGTYIEGWYAKQQANDIFGHTAWDSTVLDLVFIGEYETKGGEQTKVMYRAHVSVRVRVPDQDREPGWESSTTRADWGFCDGESKYSADAHEIALKGAVTDAFKRAMSSFGPQFGLHLYDKDGKADDLLPDKDGKKKIQRTPEEKVQLERIWKADKMIVRSFKMGTARLVETGTVQSVPLLDSGLPDWDQAQVAQYANILNSLGKIYQVLEMEATNGGAESPREPKPQ